MTNMTSCIVGKKIGAVGSGHLDLFPLLSFLCVCELTFILGQRFLKNYRTIFRILKFCTHDEYD